MNNLMAAFDFVMSIAIVFYALYALSSYFKFSETKNPRYYKKFIKSSSLACVSILIYVFVVMWG